MVLVLPFGLCSPWYKREPRRSVAANVLCLSKPIVKLRKIPGKFSSAVCVKLLP
jgi:hypothetical protein